jgi:hypothetical protein
MCSKLCQRTSYINKDEHGLFWKPLKCACYNLQRIWFLMVRLGRWWPLFLQLSSKLLFLHLSNKVHVFIKKNLVTLSNPTSWGFIMHLHIDYNFKYSTNFHYELFHHAQHLFKIIKTPNTNCDVNLQKFDTIILFPLAKI